MQTVTVDIINDGAMKLLQDMELLQLIRVRNYQGETPAWNYEQTAQLMGKMTKQPEEEVEKQLKELRDDWQ